MSRKSKNEHSNKSLAGENGSSKPTPSHDLGTVNTDPAGVIYMTYQEQLKSPKWQKKRLQVLEYYNYECQLCHNDEKELHVHHLIYRDNHLLWDYDITEYAVLCKSCHKNWHETLKLFNLELGQTFLHGDTIVWFDDLIGVLRASKEMESKEFRSIISRF